MSKMLVIGCKFFLWVTRLICCLESCMPILLVSQGVFKALVGGTVIGCEEDLMWPNVFSWKHLCKYVSAGWQVLFPLEESDGLLPRRTNWFRRETYFLSQKLWPWCPTHGLLDLYVQPRGCWAPYRKQSVSRALECSLCTQYWKRDCTASGLVST